MKQVGFNGHPVLAQTAPRREAVQYTALHDEYAACGGKVVDFHGWALPLQFAGIVQEHLHARAHAGLFDCSHMGEFLVEGAAALRAFDRLVYGDMLKLKPGRCRYSGILNESGGIIDDCVALKLSEQELYVVTNAAPLELVASLMADAVPGVRDCSGKTAKIDLQGPRSRDILLGMGLADIAPLAYWSGRRTQWNGTEILVTRAGYTGELGYELYVPNTLAPALWRALAAHPEVAPCGLGARDTLRTEMGYPLNGQDVTESKTPLEGGMDRFIAWESDFVGRSALATQRGQGGYSVLTAIKSLSRSAPRPGFEVKQEGSVVGVVTSGTFGPSVGCGVGLAYLPQALRQPGTGLTAGPRDMAIESAALPLYPHGTCRMKF